MPTTNLEHTDYRLWRQYSLYPEGKWSVWSSDIFATCSETFSAFISCTFPLSDNGQQASSNADSTHEERKCQHLQSHPTIFSSRWIVHPHWRCYRPSRKNHSQTISGSNFCSVGNVRHQFNRESAVHHSDFSWLQSDAFPVALHLLL